MKHITSLMGTAALVVLGSTAQADVVHLDDVIIDGSLCVGLDCVNGESFGFDTIRLKENNLRIKADDTSSTGSFPNVDWQLTFNDSSNGGANKFAVEDITNSRIPFVVEAAARNSALYVDDGGRVGIGLSSPTTRIHARDGNTPALRLEQDGTSGFAAQSWDLAGNETNFFIRDATNGSTLPFRIRPGAPTDSIEVNASGDVNMRGKLGIGTTSPPLTELYIQGDNDKARLRMATTDPAEDDILLNWKDEVFRISLVSSPVVEFQLDSSGNLTITGGLVTGTAGSCNVGTPCDAVFDEEVYTVPSIEEHAEQMWANKHLPAVGPTLPGQPVDVTRKLLTMLNELEHAHIYIEQLHDRISVLEEKLNEG